MNMKCREYKCESKGVAICRMKENDVKCAEHLITVEKRSQYKDVKYCWDELLKEMDEMKNEIREVQILISTMMSKYFDDRMAEKEKNQLQKMDIKMIRILEDFSQKIYDLKPHSDIDVLQFMDNQK
jgi:hypothetical protein